MDESGTITRRLTHREYAVNMMRICDYAVLGRFVRITDSRYDELYGSPDEPVAATFQVSEVLHGATVTAATVHLERTLLIAPGRDVNRAVSEQESATDRTYRYRLATETERELDAMREAGKPLTPEQYRRLVDVLWRLVEVPPRTRYELHELASSVVWTDHSSFHFHSELGAIRPDEMYLLGLTADNKEPPIGGHFNALHNYLFWGQEALDIAAAFREEQE